MKGAYLASPLRRFAASRRVCSHYPQLFQRKSCASCLYAPNGRALDSSGLCKCDTDHAWKECETAICNGHGNVGVSGICDCVGNWTGNFCQFQICDNGGEYINGKCKCAVGWGGEFCDERVCSGNGVIVGNVCVCNFPFSGPECGLECDGHGKLDLVTNKCICDQGYQGESCWDESCASDPLKSCSGHGACSLGACQCNDGWTGIYCQDPPSIQTGSCEMVFTVVTAGGYSWAETRSACKNGPQNTDGGYPNWAGTTCSGRGQNGGLVWTCTFTPK